MAGVDPGFEVGSFARGELERHAELVLALDLAFPGVVGTDWSEGRVVSAMATASVMPFVITLQVAVGDDLDEHVTGFLHRVDVHV